MFRRNRHMNIFEHYQSAGTLPIENNVSRGFAIILESCPLVFDRFIDYINEKCVAANTDTRVSKPEKVEDFDIGFQQTIEQIASSYSDLVSVVGITLTTAMTDATLPPNAHTNKDLITDIVVVSNNVVIVVEVKRTDENASVQLNYQVDSLISEIATEEDPEAVEKTLLCGTWEEIIDILQKSCAILQENERGVLGQYLQHLELRYQSWFPIKNLSELDLTEKNVSVVNKRILIAAQNACDNSEDVKQQWGGATIPTDVPFAGGALISSDYAKKALTVQIWVGDTKHQGTQYFNGLKHDLSWIYETQLGVGGQNFEIHVRPYLRFAHFNKTRFNEYLLADYYYQNLQADKQKWLELWEELSWKWRRGKTDNARHMEEWLWLTTRIADDYKGLVDSEGFKQRFEEHFEKTDRTYVDVALGFEITVPIPWPIVVKREKSSHFDKKEEDALALLIKDIVARMLLRAE